MIILLFIFCGVIVGNILKLARKEFFGLLNSKLVIIVLLVFIVALFIDLYDFYGYVNSGRYSEGIPVMRFPFILLGVLTRYGGMMSIIIGFSSMMVEKRNGTLNTLIVKPLYRDSVINGKLLGSIAFLFCVMCFASVLYVSGLLVIFNSALVPVLDVLLLRLPVVIFIAMLYVILFLSLSMLFSILIKDDAFAIFASVFTWILVTHVFPSSSFNGSITMIIVGSGTAQNDLANLFAGIYPGTNIMRICRDCNDLLSVLVTNSDELFILSLYAVITTVLSYIAFIRRDIA